MRNALPVLFFGAYYSRMTDWDLRRLRILRALDDHGTVRAAAAALSMTPSAVSQQLSALSRQAGVAVLEAHGRRVRITDAGHALLRHGDAVFAHLERAEAELAAHAAGATGRIRVGTFATAVPALVVPAVRDLKRRHPGLAVHLRETEAGEACALLAAGEVDLALSLSAQPPDATGRAPGDAGGDPFGEGLLGGGPGHRFDRTALLADPLYAALPAGHRWAQAPGLRLADLAGEDWIYGETGPWHEITVAACAAAGFTPRRAHAASDWDAILALVEAGLGVALVPRLAAPAARRGVAVRELRADRPQRYVVAAVRSGSGERPALARLLAALQRAAADHVGGAVAGADAGDSGTAT